MTAELASERIQQAERIVVLTGAGMSAESGIATFRGTEESLWSRWDPQQLATPEAWSAHPQTVWGWYRYRHAGIQAAAPHAGHLVLASHDNCEIITQNVDDLHERAGSTTVTHLHGRLDAFRCHLCHRPISVAPPQQPLSLTADLTKCPQPSCAGYARPGVVWFGENLPTDAWEHAVQSASTCDVAVIIGTSGLVYPAASLPGIAADHGAFTIEINPERTPLTPQVDLYLCAAAADIVPQLFS